MNRIITIIGIVFMLIAITPCAAASAVETPQLDDPGKVMGVLMGEVNDLGIVFTQNITLADIYIDVMESGLEKKSAQIAVTELRRIHDIQFNCFSIFKIAMVMRHPLDVVMVFRFNEQLINKVHKGVIFKTVKSAHKNAVDSKSKELVSIVDKAIAVNKDISELYEEIFKLFYKTLNESRQLEDTRTLRI